MSIININIDIYNYINIDIYNYINIDIKLDIKIYKINSMDYLEDSTSSMFLIEDKIYKVNKLILYPSKFFRTLFSTNFIEKTQDIIEINDITKTEWELLIKLLYHIMNFTYIEHIENGNNHMDSIFYSDNLLSFIEKVTWSDFFNLKDSCDRFLFGKLAKLLDDVIYGRLIKNLQGKNWTELYIALKLLPIKKSREFIENNIDEIVEFLLIDPLIFSKTDNGYYDLSIENKINLEKIHGNITISDIENFDINELIDLIILLHYNE